MCVIALPEGRLSADPSCVVDSAPPIGGWRTGARWSLFAGVPSGAGLLASCRGLLLPCLLIRLLPLVWIPLITALLCAHHSGAERVNEEASDARAGGGRAVCILRDIRERGARQGGARGGAAHSRGGARQDKARQDGSRHARLARAAHLVLQRLASSKNALASTNMGANLSWSGIEP
eukprot:2664053-Prymnesium_polylepis.1